MAAKLIVFSLLLATAHGSGGDPSFSNDMTDPSTGDVKDQNQKDIDNSIVSKYSLLDSNGSSKVEYEASSAAEKNHIVGILPSKPVEHEPSANFASGSVEPVNKATTTPTLLQVHPSQLGDYDSEMNSSTLTNHDSLPKLDVFPRPSPTYLPGALSKPGVSSRPTPTYLPGAPPKPGASSRLTPTYLPDAPPKPGASSRLTPTYLPGALSHLSAPVRNEVTSHSLLNLANPGISDAPALYTPLAQYGAHAHQAIQAPNEALGHPGLFSRFGAAGPVIHPSSTPQPSAISPYDNRSPNNSGRPKTNGFGPQGVPAVSYFSYSVVHEIPRFHSEPSTGSYNKAYDGSYSGSNGGFNNANKIYGTQRHQSDFGGSLGQGLTNSYGHDIAFPRGLPTSYSSLTRGEAYPHGYGGYGARSNVAYHANSAAGVPAGLSW